MSRLNNSYYLMRHGQSEANVAGLIISDPAVGCDRYGLTCDGRQQVSAAVSGFSDAPPTLIVCSDFLRARQTAELAAKGFGLADPICDSGLRERYFGIFEGQSDTRYSEVWADDQREISCQDRGVETVDAVQRRGLAVLARLEQTYSGETLLLVSHGDWLQILQTAFAGVSAFEHRGLVHHQTAEIKLLAPPTDD